jgi:hypothetical protein
MAGNHYLLRPFASLLYQEEDAVIRVERGDESSLLRGCFPEARSPPASCSYSYWFGSLHFQHDYGR